MHEALEHAIKSIFDLGAEQVKEGLKSHLFGIGVNDELLFLSACYLAKKDLNVSDDGILMVCRAMDTLPPSQKKKVVKIIGTDEQEYSGTGNIKIKLLENRRGAGIIKMLADLGNIPDILLVLRQIKVGDTSSSLLVRIKNILQPGINNLDSFLSSVEGKMNTSTPLRNLFNAIRK